jgi:hypothetical protein
MAMRTYWPSFSSSGSCGQYVFRGPLQPSEDAERYGVKIRYQYGAAPRVTVTDPVLDEDAPHTYSDDSLCLYKPGVFQWHDGRLVAKCIVPWTSAWLLFYEGWQETGVWFGPEAPHTHGTLKRRN